MKEIIGRNEAEISEQIRFIGVLAEKRIISGEGIFIDEPSRQLLKELLEECGVDGLGEIEEEENLTEQAATVFITLGMEWMVEATKKSVLQLVELPEGGVFGKGNPIPEDHERMIGNFVEHYLYQLQSNDWVFEPIKYKGDGTPGSNWKVNTIYRIEAVLSVMNKLMWIMGAEGEEEGEEEGMRRQMTEGVNKHLRERVIRGFGRTGEKVGEGAVPKGGLGLIVESMMFVD